MLNSTTAPRAEIIERVNTQHSIPDSTFIGEVIGKHHNIPDITSCSFFYEGSNDIYKIETSQEIYFARLTRHGKRSLASINSEIEILLELSKSVPNISTPLRSPNSGPTLSLATPEGIRYLNLFTEAKGQTANNLTLNQLKEIGRTLGAIHSASDLIPRHSALPSFNLDTCISQGASSIYKFLRNDSEIRKHSFFFQSLAIKLRKLFGSFELSSLPYGIIHGDFVSCNLHLKTDGSVSVFDFDRIGYGWRAYEVGAYLGHLASYSFKFGEKVNFSQLTEAFLKGYESKTDFSKTEKSLIPLFHLMRRLWILGVCCDNHEDWSHSFLNTKSWETEVTKLKKWTTNFQIFKF